jgi:hypothetical protein
MDSKVKMAVKPIRYTTESKYLVGWYKIPDKEHWIVKSPAGIPVGEIFQVQEGHQYYALVYGRIYPSHSGCAVSIHLRELVELMTGVALNRRT